ncbi:hypothetical protein JCM39068_17770 [Desulfocastanea catecholica]
MHDVRRERIDGAVDCFGKTLFIAGQLVDGKVTESRAGIGHDIAHAGDFEGKVADFKMDEAAELSVDAVQFGQPVAGDAGDKKIFMPCGRSLADDVLHIKSAAGALRVLTDYMEDFHFA